MVVCLLACLFVCFVLCVVVCCFLFCFVSFCFGCLFVCLYRYYVRTHVANVRTYACMHVPCACHVHVHICVHGQMDGWTDGYGRPDTSLCTHIVTRALAHIAYRLQATNRLTKHHPLCPQPFICKVRVSARLNPECIYTELLGVKDWANKQNFEAKRTHAHCKKRVQYMPRQESE